MIRRETIDDIFGWSSRGNEGGETINDIFGWSRGPYERNDEPDESDESDEQNESDESDDDDEPMPQLDFADWREWDRHSPKYRSYELVKQNVERRCFRVAYPHGYAVVPAHGNAVAEILTAAEMKAMLKHIIYFPTTSCAGEMTPQSFYPRWQRDVLIRTYEGITFAPGMPDTNKYNLWRGYKAAMLPPVPDAEVDALAAPFFHHIRTHCAEPDYVISWIAQVLHTPEQRTNVALLFHGEPGARFEFIPNVIRETLTGPMTTFQTYTHTFAKPASAKLRLHKTLIQMDGLSREDFQLRAPAMIELITGEELPRNNTGMRHECTDNYTNVILTSYTINAHAVHDPAIRKILCTTATQADCDSLRAKLANPRVQRAVFQAMMRHIE